jgi:hypothetical protein
VSPGGSSGGSGLVDCHGGAGAFARPNIPPSYHDCAGHPASPGVRATRDSRPVCVTAAPASARRASAHR